MTRNNLSLDYIYKTIALYGQRKLRMDLGSTHALVGLRGLDPRWEGFELNLYRRNSIKLSLLILRISSSICMYIMRFE